MEWIGVESVWVSPTCIFLGVHLTHPFQAGNPALPPSGSNRLDLDIFDVAIVASPVGSPQHFSLMNQDVITDFAYLQDGYTTELSNLMGISNLALPYFLIVKDTPASITYNEYSMGTSYQSTIFLQPMSTHRSFHLYLTMAYGASATFLTRLTPKYYNPEFNRKAAWKVNANAESTWVDNDNTTPVNVRVEVFDWQQGATVYSNPDDFANAPVSQVYKHSEVASVSVEIPGMTNSLAIKTIPDSGTGMPGDPLVFNIPIINENFLAAGDYVGLVKVTDTRIPNVSPDLNRDCIVLAPDGKTIMQFEIPSYSTFQTFAAHVNLH